MIIERTKILAAYSRVIAELGEHNHDHEDFDATVAVARLEDTGRFMCEVRIKCVGCGVPFQFPGLDLDGARVSIDGLEANIAICPNGMKPSPVADRQTLIGARQTL